MSAAMPLQHSDRARIYLARLRNAIARLELARKCGDEMTELEAFSDLDLAWSSLQRERGKPQ